MEATKNGVVGREVYDKKAGLMGRVVKEDGLQMTIEFDDGDKKTTKTVTPATFKRWYRLLDEDKPATELESADSTEEEPVASDEGPSEDTPDGDAPAEEPKAEEKPKKKREAKPKAPPKYPSGEAGVGAKLASHFRLLIGEMANQDLDYGSTKDPRMVVVRYNGRNVFEATVCNRRLNVLCHQKSLSPDTLKRATRVMPEKYGWPLSVQFTFTEMSEETTALMRCLITDGLYYRQKVEKEEAEAAEAAADTPADETEEG